MLQPTEEVDIPPVKKTIHHRKTMLTIVMILVFLTAATGCVIWRYQAHRYVHGKVTFQEYVPKYFPPNLSIVDKSIEAWYVPAADPIRYTMLHLGLSGGSYIYEKKNARHFTYSCAAGNIVGEGCSVERTPDGQAYVLTITSSPKQPVNQAAEWLKGDTNIRLNLEAPNGQGYPRTTMEKIIDSFTKVDYKGLPVDYIDRSSI